LTIRNFVLHPDRRGPQRTDSDLLAFRFPFRNELNMPDDDWFASQRVATAMFVEIKTGPCHFNGPWTRREDQNLQRVLAAVGLIEPEGLTDASDALYGVGGYSASTLDIVLVALGNEVDESLLTRLPRARQVTWDAVLRFIFHRFTVYRARKAHHPQWDFSGSYLYALAIDCRRDFEQFQARTRSDYALH
jgi:hypothetical protein